MSLEDVKNQLIDLYLCVKVRKSDDIKKMTPEIINNEKRNLKILPITDIINYIQNSIDVLVEMKALEKLRNVNKSRRKYKRPYKSKNIIFFNIYFNLFIE